MTQRRASHVLSGTRIRERRIALSRRQADVARDAGISPAYLNLIEHNRRPVGDDLMARLAEALQVPAEELAAGREEARIAGLREVAARLAGQKPEPAPELDQLPEFVARFPGWSGAALLTARRAEALERQLISLSDRMRQDPYLVTTLHEVLSAVTSLRSTAGILADDAGDIPHERRQRFHVNLIQDSMRLSNTAQSLVGYLDSFETDGANATPQDEVEAWLASGAPPVEDSPDLASDAARQIAAAIRQRMQIDRSDLPDDILRDAAQDLAPDPLRIAAALGRPPDLVLRRLADLRPKGFEAAGILACDASGTLTLRRPAPGFPLPRLGDACALWPLFQALAQPQTAIHSRIEAPDGARFDTVSLATRRQPDGIDGPVLSEAQMLILPVGAAAPAGRGRVIRIGPSCRICSRANCAARREPSVLLEN